MKKNAPLSDELYEKIRIDILNETFAPGFKFTEQMLCDRYGVSRTPVREALKQLENVDLIEMIPHRGAFVTGFSKDDLVDLFTLREIYEVQAVRWAIERITEDEYDALEESFEFMEFYTLRNDAKRMVDINANFHRIIYEASHNRMLERVLMSFQTYIKNSSHAKPYEKNHLDEVFGEHKAIFDSFKEKDPDAGENAIRVHIQNSGVRAVGD